MSKISKSVLEKIKKDQVKPKPKWWFVAMHAGMWLAIGVSILVGSMAMGVLIHEFSGAEWVHVGRLSKDGVPGFLLMLPYIWFGALGLTLFLSYRLFAHTKKGYKHQPYAIVGATALVSVLLGTGLYITRTAERFEAVMIERVPPYAEYMKGRERLLAAPDHGVLPGVIIDEENGVMIIVNDVERREWEVDISAAKYRPRDVEIGHAVLAIGEKTGDFDFTAAEIKPFRPRISEDFYRRVKKVKDLRRGMRSSE